MEAVSEDRHGNGDGKTGREVGGESERTDRCKANRYEEILEYGGKKRHKKTTQRSIKIQMQ